jgi:hypothetical protein
MAGLDSRDREVTDESSSNNRRVFNGVEVSGSGLDIPSRNPGGMKGSLRIFEPMMVSPNLDGNLSS